MDDDTYPRPTALALLLAASAACRRRPEILASSVLWHDGSPHPLNVVAPRRGRLPERPSTPLPIRLGSFVSLLVSRQAVDRHGLPVAAFFIWSDDIEFTARVLRRGFGLLVPQSRVVHDTAAKGGTLDAAPSRFFFYARNHLWMLRYSPGFSRREKIRSTMAYCYTAVRYLARWRCAPAAIAALLRGAWAGLCRRPTARS